MRDRLLTAAGALLALLALIAVSFSEYEPPPTRPTSAEAGPNGYRALHLWLRDAGIEVVSHRDRLEDLTTRYGTGNLLVSTAPYQAQMRTDEATELRAWVAAGNTLLLLAALNDTPNWALSFAPRSFLDDLQALTGIEFEPVLEEDAARLLDAVLAPRAVELSPIAEHPLASGIRSLVAETDHPSAVWKVASAKSQKRLRIAVMAERTGAAKGAAEGAAQREGIDAIWHIPHGRGHIVLSGLGSLFVNRNLGKADNAVFVANVIRHHLRQGSAAIFDDLHQGLSSLYDPTAFFKDRRFHASVAFVLALWFLYMVGTWNRLAKPRPPANEPGQQDFVRAVGGFFARKLGAVEAGRQLMQAAFVELAGPGAGFERPPWARLNANPAIDRTLLGAIKADHARLQSGQRVDLLRLRRQLAQLGAMHGQRTQDRRRSRAQTSWRGKT